MFDLGMKKKKSLLQYYKFQLFYLISFKLAHNQMTRNQESHAFQNQFLEAQTTGVGWYKDPEETENSIFNFNLPI